MAQPHLFAPPARPWAVISKCERYRYVLAWPTGLEDDRYALFVLANPSTATAEQTDPTVARCIGYARITPHALKLNKDGSPQHPLYLRRDAVPVPIGREVRP
jgi:hypothetical protein